MKESLRAADLVSGNALATHLGCTRQNVARLTAEGIIERRPDGRYNQVNARLAYIRHLRSERRSSARSQADAAFTAAKTKLILMRVQEKERTTIPLAEAVANIDLIMGVLLTHLGSMPALIGGNDLALRRRVEKSVFDTRVAISEAASKLADARGEPLEETEA